MADLTGATQQVVGGVALTEHDSAARESSCGTPLLMVHGGCPGSWQWARWQAEVNVATVRSPVLVVAGEDDVLTPPEMVRGLARGLGAAAISLPDAGHGVTLDPGWPRLCERIDAWLHAVHGRETYTQRDAIGG